MLLTVSMPSSTPSSASSADGLAPERKLIMLWEVMSTNVDVCTLFDGDHLAVNFVDYIIDFLPENLALMEERSVQ